MIDDTLLTFVDKFNGILNGENMMFADFIDFVCYSCKRCGLTGTGWPSNKDQAFRQCRKFGNDFRQPQLVTGQNFTGNFTKNSTYSIFLLKKVTAVTSQPGDFITKVHIAQFFKYLYFVIRADFIEHGFQFFIFKYLELDALHIATDTQNRLLAGNHM